MLLVRAGSRLAVGSSARITAGRCASARDRDPLLLAARELVRAPLGEVAESHLIQARARELAVGAWEASEHVRHRRHVAEPSGEHVVERGGAPDQVELPEDHPDLAADLAYRGRAGARDGAACHTDRPRRRLDQAIQALSASEQTASNASARGSIRGECTIEAPYRRRQERLDQVELTAMGLERDIVIRVADLVDVDPCTGRLSIDGRVTSVVLTEEHRSLMEKMVRRLVDELPELPYKVEAIVDFAPDGLPRVVLRLKTS